jgi:hypothetical protein
MPIAVPTTRLVIHFLLAHVARIAVIIQQKFVLRTIKYLGCDVGGYCKLIMFREVRAIGIC